MTLLSAVLAVAAASGADFKEIHKTVPLDPGGRVSIDTFKGSIDVTTWDRPEIDIVARIEPDDSGRDQARRVQETEVRVAGSGQSVRITSDYDRVHRSGFLGIFGGDETLPFVRYTIQLPRTARLAVKDYKSNTHIAGLAGTLDLNTYKGEVEIASMDGSVQLETYKGEVRADFTRLAESEFETYKGSVEITLPQPAAFDLEADLGRHGDLDCDFELVTRASGWSSRDARRRGVVNGGGPELKLETYKGTFRIRAR
jgi:hypothetical protein